MCAIVSQDISDGGVSGKSIYIDTEGTFRPERIELIAKARGFDFSLDNILLVEPEDSYQQELIVDNIDSLLKDKTNRYKLLIVDSPVTHYRSEYIGRAMLSERQQRLYKFIRQLVKIAHQYNIAVVVINHINTTVSRKMRGMPAGGNVMGHALTYSVRLWTLNQFNYHARIVGSPYHPQKTKSFYISAKGLVDVNPSAVDLPPLSTFDWDSFLDT